MDTPPNAADALAEIDRVQRGAYAGQRLPLWYLPGVIALVTTAGIASDQDGTAQAVLTSAAVVGLAVLTGTLAARTRVRWRARTWTVSAGVRMLLWMASICVVWGIVPPAVGTLTGSAAWQKAVAGVVAALYAAATTRWAEDQVTAHAAGAVVR
ncbi:hypothetical protein [Streptomyces sp. NPDC059783]|uniref:hypothetical protein n=1 Tax=Streptomyces sp. NPDC059783 TaxID=3346944 RepID=UPI003646E946